MTTHIKFDVRTVGLNSLQDSGAATLLGYVPANIVYITANSAAFDISKNDVRLIDGKLFKTGEAIGFLGMFFNGSEYHIGVNQFSLFEFNGRCYVRFGYVNFTLKSTSVVYS